MKLHALGRLIPSRRQSTPRPSTEYAFCERVTAGPGSPWHIRPLGPKGLCPSGGADTTALCGAIVSWDIPNCEVDEGRVTRLLDPEIRGVHKDCADQWHMRNMESSEDS